MWGVFVIFVCVVWMMVLWCDIHIVITMRLCEDVREV